jgi:hypothetical protein
MKKATAMVDLVHRSKGSMIAPREVLKSIEVLAPQAVTTLEHLMLNSKVDTVRLKAAVEILELAGVSKETRISVRTDTRDMSDSEIDSRLRALMGTAAGTVLEGTYKDVTPDVTTEAEEFNEIQ